jgi:hypothetical protein
MPKALNQFTAKLETSSDHTVACRTLRSPPSVMFWVVSGLMDARPSQTVPVYQIRAAGGGQRVGRGAGTPRRVIALSGARDPVRVMELHIRSSQFHILISYFLLYRFLNLYLKRSRDQVAG